MSMFAPALGALAGTGGGAALGALGGGDIMATILPMLLKNITPQASFRVGKGSSQGLITLGPRNREDALLEQLMQAMLTQARRAGNNDLNGASNMLRTIGGSSGPRNPLSVSGPNQAASMMRGLRPTYGA